MKKQCIVGRGSKSTVLIQLSTIQNHSKKSNSS